MDTGELFKQCDSNGDGLICLGDLLTVFGGSEGGFSDDDLKEVMLQLDSGGSVRRKCRSVGGGGGGHSLQTLSF